MVERSEGKRGAKGCGMEVMMPPSQDHRGGREQQVTYPYWRLMVKTRFYNKSISYGVCAHTVGTSSGR